MCLYPKLIKNRKYSETKKNKGIIPEIKDERTTYVAIGCGKCIECMKQKKRAWQTRLHEEIKKRNNGKFITLTFSEKSIEELERDIGSREANDIATVAARRFFERWRKKYKKSVPHWLITELGHKNTERIHLHGILFTDAEDIGEIWGYGEIYIGEYVNGKTINYIVKYVTKIDTEHKGYQPKILCSPGIGKGYEKGIDAGRNKFKKGATDETYRLPNGFKVNLPIYYRNKIYSEEEREKLWIEKLDRKKRYIRGQEIDVSTKAGWIEYLYALKYAQKRNTETGYGSDLWIKEKYEASIRKINEENLEIQKE